MKHGRLRLNIFPAIIRPFGRNCGGFTLIELLVVVAIIAILALIAVFNLLEAQTRSKVARAKADMRTVATALEAYCVDANDYPPNTFYSVLPVELSTPVAFLTSVGFVDPFMITDTSADYGQLIRSYTYMRICTREEALASIAGGRPVPNEAIDDPTPGYNFRAKKKYGEWRMLSNGPDHKPFDKIKFASNVPLYGSDILYDPTNGTVSWGNILRLQNYPEGK